jgi:hypothetical protein
VATDVINFASFAADSSIQKVEQLWQDFVRTKVPMAMRKRVGLRVAVGRTRCWASLLHAMRLSDHLIHGDRPEIHKPEHLEGLPRALGVAAEAVGELRAAAAAAAGAAVRMGGSTMEHHSVCLWAPLLLHGLKGDGPPLQPQKTPQTATLNLSKP